MTRLITTVGGAYSNSYVTLDQANLIAANFPWYADWNTFSDEEKTQALIQAAFAMQQLPWDGTKCSPASDAGLPKLNWDKYWITVDSIADGGIFDYLEEKGLAGGVGQGDEVFKYGTEDSTLFSDVSSFRAKTFETSFKFWDENDVELSFDETELVSSSGSGGDRTIDIIYKWNTPVNIAYVTGKFNDTFNPSRSGTWYHGVYVNGDKLLNFPGTSATQAQRLAWPRSGVTCDGETADCSFIPETIMITQVIIAYNFLKNPDQVPGTPGSGNDSPTGTFIKRQKIDVLEIEYDQYSSNQYNIDCNSCDDPYLIQVYPWLRDLLGCWLTTEGTSKNRLIRLLRN